MLPPPPPPECVAVYVLPKPPAAVVAPPANVVFAASVFNVSKCYGLAIDALFAALLIYFAGAPPPTSEVSCLSCLGLLSN